MRISIIGLGDSAKHWDGSGPSIGVNDVYKFGHHPTYLLILNAPKLFNGRLETITSTKPHKVYTDQPHSWQKHFTNIPVNQFLSRLWSSDRKVSKNYLYHSKTSPFAAISLAYSWGFTEIVLYGVDFVNHHKYNPSNKHYTNEFNNYKSFCDRLKEIGVNVYRISEESNLKFLPIWDGK